jgi:hypothetical protein
MRFIRLFLVLVFTAATSFGADRPNVMFIAIDDLNHWVNASVAMPSR